MPLRPFIPWIKWPAFAGLTLLIYNILPYQSTFVETYYSRGIFKIYRLIWDHTIAMMPLGLIYVLIIVLLFLIALPIFRRHTDRPLWKVMTLRVIKILSIGVVSFYWLWAFNYKRSSFRTIAEMESIQPDPSFVFDEYCRVTDSLESIRNLIIQDVDSLWVDVGEARLRQDLQAAYREMQLPYAGRVRAVKLHPSGALLRISTAGVYLPFVGQGHIDNGLHPITHPFTMLHEMSHGYGWTGEDVCNFLALLAAVNSDLPEVRYSGYFGYWRYLRGQIYQIDHERFDTFYRNAPQAIMKDYQDIINASNRYPDIMPMIRDVFYDQYLKSHGIPSGLVNYSQMILLSHDWIQKHGSLVFDE